MRRSGLVTFNLNGDPFSDGELRYGLEGLAEHLEGYDKDTILDYIESMDEDDGFESSIAGDEEELSIAFEKIDKLQEIINGIIVRNGINKTVAMEAKTVYSDLNIDIRKLSDQNTNIGLEFALGEMTTAKKGLIAAAVAIVAAIIYKIVKWFRGDKSGDGEPSSGGVSAEEKKETSEKATQVVNATNTVMKKVIDKADETIKTIGVSLKSNKPTDEEISKLEEDNKKILDVFINYGTDMYVVLDKFIELKLLNSATGFKNFIETMNSTDSIAKDILENGLYTNDVLKIANLIDTSKELELSVTLKSVIDNLNSIKVKGTAPMKEALSHDLKQLIEILNNSINSVSDYYDKFGEVETNLGKNNNIVLPSTIIKYIKNNRMPEDENRIKVLVKTITVTQEALDLNIKEFENLKKSFANPDNDGTLVGIETGFEEMARNILSKTSSIIQKRASIDLKLSNWIRAKDNLTFNAIVGVKVYSDMFSHLKVVLSKLNHDKLYDAHLKNLDIVISGTKVDIEKHLEEIKHHEVMRNGGNSPADRVPVIIKVFNALNIWPGH